MVKHAEGTPGQGLKAAQVQEEVQVAASTSRAVGSILAARRFKTAPASKGVEGQGKPKVSWAKESDNCPKLRAGRSTPEG